jgi:hypothetical protein
VHYFTLIDNKCASIGFSQLELHDELTLPADAEEVVLDACDDGNGLPETRTNDSEPLEKSETHREVDGNTSDFSPYAPVVESAEIDSVDSHDEGDFTKATERYQLEAFFDKEGSMDNFKHSSPTAALKESDEPMTAKIVDQESVDDQTGPATGNSPEVTGAHYQTEPSADDSPDATDEPADGGVSVKALIQVFEKIKDSTDSLDELLDSAAAKSEDSETAKSPRTRVVNRKASQVDDDPSKSKPVFSRGSSRIGAALHGSARQKSMLSRGSSAVGEGLSGSTQIDEVLQGEGSSRSTLVLSRGSSKVGNDLFGENSASRDVAANQTGAPEIEGINLIPVKARVEKWESFVRQESALSQSGKATDLPDVDADVTEEGDEADLETAEGVPADPVPVKVRIDEWEDRAVSAIDVFAIPPELAQRQPVAKRPMNPVTPQAVTEFVPPSVEWQQKRKASHVPTDPADITSPENTLEVSEAVNETGSEFKFEVIRNAAAADPSRIVAPSHSPVTKMDAGSNALASGDSNVALRKGIEFTADAAKAQPPLGADSVDVAFSGKMEVGDSGQGHEVAQTIADHEADGASNNVSREAKIVADGSSGPTKGLAKTIADHEVAHTKTSVELDGSQRHADAGDQSGIERNDQAHADRIIQHSPSEGLQIADEQDGDAKELGTEKVSRPTREELKIIDLSNPELNDADNGRQQLSASVPKDVIPPPQEEAPAHFNDAVSEDTGIEAALNSLFPGSESQEILPSRSSEALPAPRNAFGTLSGDLLCTSSVFCFVFFFFDFTHPLLPSLISWRSCRKGSETPEHMDSHSSIGGPASNPLDSVYRGKSSAEERPSARIRVGPAAAIEKDVVIVKGIRYLADSNPFRYGSVFASFLKFFFCLCSFFKFVWSWIQDGSTEYHTSMQDLQVRHVNACFMKLDLGV